MALPASRFRVVTLESGVFYLAEKMTEHVVKRCAMLVGLIFEQIELAEQEGHQ